MPKKEDGKKPCKCYECVNFQKAKPDINEIALKDKKDKDKTRSE